MSVPLKFPISILVQDGDYILKAAEARTGELAARIKPEVIASVRSLHTSVKDKIPVQASAKAGVGELTVAQDAAWKVAKKLVSKARETAVKAFPGQDVKLHNEFQVGHSDATNLADFLQNVRIIEASCKVAANAAAMGEWGWIASDTDALGTAIEALDTADDVQETSKGGGTGATDARNIDANALFDGLLKIQSAADLQYSEDDPANGPTRVAFRLGLFPPRKGGNNPAPPTPPTPPPAP